MRKERLTWGSDLSASSSAQSTLSSRATPSSANQSATSVRTQKQQVERTHIAAGCGVAGELFFSGISEINCRVDGDIAAEGELVLGESAQVCANIRAEALVVFGALEGDVVCSERIELHAGARVKGAICSPSIVMHDGVHFEGECSMPLSEPNSSSELEGQIANE